jgi:LmbE family N-acetylglucosaminyl deacetylase
MTQSTLAPAPATPHVLLVEDDIPQSVVIDRWLQRAGFNVTTSHDGYEAALLACSGRFDAMVVDVELPTISGLEVVRHAKAMYPTRPAVVVTAHQSMDYALQAIRAKADDVLHKPLTCDDLGHRMRALLTASRRPRSVLAIGAHPDDVEIGAGGTLLRHRARGDRVTVLTMSGGASGGDPEVRGDEARAAASVLDVGLVLGDLGNHRIVLGPSAIELISTVVAEVQPDVIYTHTARDLHHDHRAVHAASLVAGKGVKKLYCYQSQSSTQDFQASRFVNVTPHLNGKIRAIKAYASQGVLRPFLAEKFLRATARHWGRVVGFDDVEAFETARSAE